jgi:hypothetical protein
LPFLGTRRTSHAQERIAPMTRVLSVAVLATILACVGASIQPTLISASTQKPTTQKPATQKPAAQKPAAQPRGLGSSREIMEVFTIPLSDAVFAAGGSPPTDDTKWEALQGQALALAESANLLLIRPRLIATGSWTKWAAEQRDAAVAVMNAARKKDADALSAAADALYETCAGCHKVYLPSQ